MRRNHRGNVAICIAPALFMTLVVGCSSAPPAESPSATPNASNPANPAAPSETSAMKEPASGSEEFQIKDSDSAKSARGVNESKIKATKDQAAVRFFVVDRNADDKPIPGIVVSLTAPDGKKFYTEETDAAGFAEVLVPIAQDYEIVYLTLGRRDITAKLSVKDKPNQNLKLTLRYKKIMPEVPKGAERPVGFILDGITFQTAKATIMPESFPRLDAVVEFMNYKKSARIQISGHTDNVGKPASNKTLSEKRAQACRDYLIQKGIDGSRIEAVGFGDEQPIAPNDSEEGRSKNRRIEAKEI